MLLFITLMNISLGSLLFGYVPETVALMIFGICLVASSIGLRRFLKHHEERKTEEQAKDTIEG